MEFNSNWRVAMGRQWFPVFPSLQVHQIWIWRHSLSSLEPSYKDSVWNLDCKERHGLLSSYRLVLRQQWQQAAVSCVPGEYWHFYMSGPTSRPRVTLAQKYASRHSEKSSAEFLTSLVVVGTTILIKMLLYIAKRQFSLRYSGFSSATYKSFAFY